MQQTSYVQSTGGSKHAHAQQDLLPGSAASPLSAADAPHCRA